MTGSALAWQQLQDALAIQAPPCRDDARFTAETREHDAALAEVCERCPAMSLCATYARNASITKVYGFYGGLVRRGSHRQS